MPIEFKNISGTGGFTLVNNTNSGNIILSKAPPPPPPTYTIGQSALGGKIAYILQSGDTGYDPNVQHGLVVSNADLGTANWANISYLTVTGATGTAIGTGNQNTTIIVNAVPTAGIAARLCDNLVEGGYSDWYLPSVNELNKLYVNRVALGGFSSAYYWSSTETDFRTAYVQNLGSGGFPGGYQTSLFKYNVYNVRAIRSF